MKKKSKKKFLIQVNLIKNKHSFKKNIFFRVIFNMKCYFRTIYHVSWGWGSHYKGQRYHLCSSFPFYMYSICTYNIYIMYTKYVVIYEYMPISSFSTRMVYTWENSALPITMVKKIWRGYLEYFGYISYTECNT